MPKKNTKGRRELRLTPYTLLSVLPREPRELARLRAGTLVLQLVELPRVRLRERSGLPGLSGWMKTSRQVSALSLVSRLILTAGISPLSACSLIPSCNYGGIISIVRANSRTRNPVYSAFCLRSLQKLLDQEFWNLLQQYFLLLPSIWTELWQEFLEALPLLWNFSCNPV